MAVTGLKEVKSGQQHARELASARQYRVVVGSAIDFLQQCVLLGEERDNQEILSSVQVVTPYLLQWVALPHLDDNDSFGLYGPSSTPSLLPSDTTTVLPRLSGHENVDNTTKVDNPYIVEENVRFRASETSDGRYLNTRNASVTNIGHIGHGVIRIQIAEILSIVMAKSDANAISNILRVLSHKLSVLPVPVPATVPSTTTVHSKSVKIAISSPLLLSMKEMWQIAGSLTALGELAVTLHHLKYHNGGDGENKSSLTSLIEGMDCVKEDSSIMMMSPSSHVDYSTIRVESNVSNRVLNDVLQVIEKVWALGNRHSGVNLNNVTGTSEETPPRLIDETHYELKIVAMRVFTALAQKCLLKVDTPLTQSLHSLTMDRSVVLLRHLLTLLGSYGKTAGIIPSHPTSSSTNGDLPSQPRMANDQVNTTSSTSATLVERIRPFSCMVAAAVQAVASVGLATGGQSGTEKGLLLVVKHYTVYRIAFFTYCFREFHLNL